LQIFELVIEIFQFQTAVKRYGKVNLTVIEINKYCLIKVFVLLNIWCYSPGFTVFLGLLHQERGEPHPSEVTKNLCILVPAFLLHQLSAVVQKMTFLVLFSIKFGANFNFKVMLEPHLLKLFFWTDLVINISTIASKRAQYLMHK
jgi:hypothetical protein